MRTFRNVIVMIVALIFSAMFWSQIDVLGAPGSKQAESLPASGPKTNESASAPSSVSGMVFNPDEFEKNQYKDKVIVLLGQVTEIGQETVGLLLLKREQGMSELNIDAEVRLAVESPVHLLKDVVVVIQGKIDPSVRFSDITGGGASWIHRRLTINEARILRIATDDEKKFLLSQFSSLGDAARKAKEERAQKLPKVLAAKEIEISNVSQGPLCGQPSTKDYASQLVVEVIIPFLANFPQGWNLRAADCYLTDSNGQRFACQGIARPFNKRNGADFWEDLPSERTRLCKGKLKWSTETSSETTLIYYIYSEIVLTKSTSHLIYDAPQKGDRIRVCLTFSSELTQRRGEEFALYVPGFRSVVKVASPGEQTTSQSIQNPEEKAKNRLKLAQLYIDGGLKDKAIELLREIIQLYPNTEAAKEAQSKLTALGG